MKGRRIVRGAVAGRDFRTIAGVGLLGAAAAGALVLIGNLPQVLASDTPTALEAPLAALETAVRQFRPPAVDPQSLVKWDFTADPGISSEPIRQSTIRKIGFGRMESIDIVETASGIYSSDAMGDPHVLYPGINRQRKADVASLSVWNGFGWTPAAPLTAGSFITITPFEGGSLIVSEDGMCVVTKGSMRC